MGHQCTRPFVGAVVAKAAQVGDGFLHVPSQIGNAAVVPAVAGVVDEDLVCRNAIGDQRIPVVEHAAEFAVDTREGQHQHVGVGLEVMQIGEFRVVGGASE